MKTIPLISILTLSLTALAGPTHAQYVNREFRPGENLFGNPLLNTNSNLSFLIPSPPEGTTVSLWNPAVGAYTTTLIFSTDDCNGWCGDLILSPGQGARLVTGILFTNTFVGTVLNPDGTTYTGNVIRPPPVYTGSNGIYLLSSKCPLVLSGTDTNVTYPVFNYILGRGPLVGETFTRINPTNQTYRTTIWSGSAWSDGVPALDVSEAGLFNIGPVPVPRFEVTAIVREGNNMRISWTSFGPHTNYVQASNGSLSATNASSFADISGGIIVLGSGQTITNYLDVGGATNTPSRFYRVRLGP